MTPGAATAAWLAWLLPALPLAAGAILAVTAVAAAGRTKAGAGRRVSAVAPWAAMAVAAVTLVLAAAAAAVHPAAMAPLFRGIPAAVRVDGLSAVMVVTVAAVTLAVLVFAAGDLGPQENRGRFFGLMLLFAGGWTGSRSRANATGLWSPPGPHRRRAGTHVQRAGVRGGLHDRRPRYERDHGLDFSREHRLRFPISRRRGCRGSW
jgi:hypothetical protein